MKGEEMATRQGFRKISRRMFKVLFNGKFLSGHIDQIKKGPTSENEDSQVHVWETTILLLTALSQNKENIITGKQQYPAKSQL